VCSLPVADQQRDLRCGLALLLGGACNGVLAGEVGGEDLAQGGGALGVRRQHAAQGGGIEDRVEELRKEDEIPELELSLGKQEEGGKLEFLQWPAQEVDALTRAVSHWPVCFICT
jgi:hypothetical protein